MPFYEFTNQHPGYPDKYKDENIKEYKEVLFDRISQLLIENFTQIESAIVSEILIPINRESPIWFEDFDINNDGVFNDLDIQAWGSVDREDIAMQVAQWALSGDTASDYPQKAYESILGSGGSLKFLQKTIREGTIQIGIQNEDELIVLYQSDTEANKEDKPVMDSLVQFFDYTHPEYISMEFKTIMEGEYNVPKTTIILKDENGNSLDMNTVISGLGLENFRIKDNVSQFIEIPRIKTNINNSKLAEYVDTTFIEIRPKTG